MKFKTLLLLTATLVALAGNLTADSNYYFWHNGGTAFAGNVQAEPYKANKAVEVLSFALSGSREDDVTSIPNQGPGGVNFDRVELLLEIDTTAVPKFLQLTAAGTQLDEVILEGVTQGGEAPKKFLTMSFKRIKFTEFQIEGVQGDRAVVAATFAWGAVQMQTHKINSTNGTLETDQTVSWSRVLGTATYSVTQ